jgi:hypothetical protein
MGEVVNFPEPNIRISDFMAEEAMKQQVRQCLGCAVGVFHGQPDARDMLLALEKLDEAMTLMKSYWALRSHG